MSEAEQSESPDGVSRPPDLADASKIEILCACDEAYLPHTATMLCSLLEHNPNCRVHIIHGSIAKRELSKLKSFLAKYGSTILCYEMVRTDFPDLQVDRLRSVAVYYRLAAPRVLPMNLHKILYLDSDIIVRHTLKDLWNIDLGDYALAAVEDMTNPWELARLVDVLGMPPGAKPFNSGVMLINLVYWRQHNIFERAVAFIGENPEKVECWDQDALNVLLVHRWIELPISWHYQIMSDPAVVHFWGAKPWRWSARSGYNQEYHRYRLKTPWWRYRLEGRPGLPRRLHRSLRSFVRVLLPANLRQGLRRRLLGSQA